MTVTELMERLTGIGATVRADGDQVAVCFPEKQRRHVEELAPEIQRLKPQLMRVLVAVPGESLDDIALALKIATYLETAPVHHSVTASEIAEALHGRDYTLAQVIDVYRICEELRDALILIRGQDGYGYQRAYLRMGGAR